MSSKAADPTVLIRVKITQNAYLMLERRAKQVNRPIDTEAGYLLHGAMVDLIRRDALQSTIRGRVDALRAERAGNDS